MSQIQGKVFKIYSKEFPPRGGKPGNIWYSVKLDGDPRYYRCKGHNPGSVEGKEVAFTVSDLTDKDAQVDTKSIKVVEAKAQQSNASVGTASIGTTSRDSSIHYQSSRKDALVFVGMSVAAGALKLPAKEAARLDALEALVDAKTAEYYNDIGTLGAVARATGTAETETADVTDADEE